MIEAGDQTTDIALMLRVREGDDAAFEELHHRYQRKLLNFFYALSGDTHAASELCQEVFLRVWKVRKRYRASGSFPGYLFGVARMIWFERRREERKCWGLGVRQIFDIEAEPAAGLGSRPDTSASRLEMEGCIREALAALPEEQRMVFIMRSIQGFSLEYIAEALDCPLNTVRSRKILAVKKMREMLSRVFASAWDRCL